MDFDDYPDDIDDLYAEEQEILNQMGPDPDEDLSEEQATDRYISPIFKDYTKDLFGNGNAHTPVIDSRRIDLRDNFDIDAVEEERLKCQQLLSKEKPNMNSKQLTIELQKQRELRVPGSVIGSHINSLTSQISLPSSGGAFKTCARQPYILDRPTDEETGNITFTMTLGNGTRGFLRRRPPITNLEEEKKYAVANENGLLGRSMKLIEKEAEVTLVQ